MDIPTNWLVNFNKLFLKAKIFFINLFFNFSFKNLVLRVNQDSTNYNYIENFLKMRTNTMISSYAANI